MLKDTIFQKTKSLRFRDKLFFIESPIVMGIINLTPDSFYAGSRIQSIDEFLRTIDKMLDEGATIIDIGAASSRPNALMLSAADEQQRLRPYLEVLYKTFPNTWFSIDTYNAETAKWCVEKYGFFMINDISAYSFDSAMFDTIIQLNVPYVLMHIKGTPQTMQQQASYQDLIAEIIQFLGEKKHELTSNGLNDLIIDPGFGFGKTIQHDFELLKNLKDFEVLECPLLVGLSRKSMIYKTLAINPDEALAGSIALQTISILNNADIIRTHDVKETVQTIKLIEAYIQS